MKREANLLPMMETDLLAVADTADTAPPTFDTTPQVQALRARLQGARRSALKPPPKLTLPQWADQYRMLPAESSAEPGRWKTSRVAVARGPMEAVSDVAVHTVSVMCCTQLLKTELILNTIGYHVHQDPAPMIVMQPTDTLAEAFSKDRVAPMVRDSPALTGKIADAKSRNSGNTILHKQFPGGHLTMVGANAPGNLAMRPVRIVLCDEIDKYPETAGKEGDPVALVSERAATFWNYKLIFVCSPTIEGRSRIALEYENGDQRVFEVDCPHCGHRHEMQWRNVKWPEGKPDKALYHCPECEQPWTEPERQRAIKAASERPCVAPSRFGEHYEGFGWRGTKPFNGHASFRASKLASPWESVAKLAAKFVKAQASQELLKTFINTQLAETWKEKGEAPDWKRLYERREPYKRNVVPAGGLMLTCGVDVQKDRLELEVLAVGPNLRTWSVDYRVFEGDTASLDADCWKRLADMLTEEWPHEAAGVCMRLDRMGIDSGFNTQTVYNFVRKHGRNHPGRVMATKGQEVGAALIGIPQSKEAKVNGKRAKRGVKVWHIGLNIAKSELYGFLRLEKPEDESAPLPHGWCHFPEYDDEYFKQLTAEHSVAKVVRGYTKHVWEKTRERNEALDCRIIARAVASAFGADRWREDQWNARAAELGAPVIVPAQVEEPQQPSQQSKEERQETKAESRPRQEIKWKKSSFW